MHLNKSLVEFCGDLKNKRQELNISCEEVAKKLKIRESYILAIEKGDIDKIPSQAYFLGYVKSYSEFLGEKSFEYFKQNYTPVNENYKLKPQEVVSSSDLLPSISTLLVSIAFCVAIIIISYFIL